MGAENPLETFNKKLAALTPKPVRNEEMEELWGLSIKFDKEIEKNLVAAETRILEKEPISTVAGILQEAGVAIEQRNGNTGAIEKRLQYIIDFIGDHGEGIYPEWENTGKFVKSIESGKSIESSIQGVQIFFIDKVGGPNGHVRIGARVSRDENSGEFFKIKWFIGQENGDFNLGKNDILGFAELIATKISERRYYVPTDYSGWSYEL